MIKVSAPGKVHLTSAHIVVYGKPAILCSVNLRITSSIANQINNNRITIKSNFLDQEIITTSKEAVACAKEAKKSWEDYVFTNDISKIKPLTKPMNFLQIIIGETLLYLDKKLSNVHIEIKSEVPVGANFGGSASLSASLCGAIFRYYKKDLNKDEIYQIVYETEKRVHGNPSGGDPAVVIYGGIIWFRKETEFLKLFKRLSFTNFPEFIIVNSGKPEESTGEMVHLVRKLVNKRPKYVCKIFQKMEELKKKFIVALEENNKNKMIGIMRKDTRFLIKLGVVSESTKQIIKELEAMGFGVSVSGACGKKSGSGALILLGQDVKSAIAYCNNKKLQYHKVSFQTDGIREENE